MPPLCSKPAIFHVDPTTELNSYIQVQCLIHDTLHGIHFSPFPLPELERDQQPTNDRSLNTEVIVMGLRKLLAELEKSLCPRQSRALKPSVTKNSEPSLSSSTAKPPFTATSPSTADSSSPAASSGYSTRPTPTPTPTPTSHTTNSPTTETVILQIESQPDHDAEPEITYITPFPLSTDELAAWEQGIRDATTNEERKLHVEMLKDEIRLRGTCVGAVQDVLGGY